VERDLLKIASHYYAGSFWWDLVPLLPFHLLKMNRNRNHLFFILKVFRIRRSITALDPEKLLIIIKSRHLKTMNKRCKEDPLYANDKRKDNNKITFILLLSYTFKIIHLFYIILSASFYFGVSFKIICDLEADINDVDIFKRDVDLTNFPDPDSDRFITINDFYMPKTSMF
jgi:hypothetical protein